ncbi:hypothetical protein ATI61_11062 [Archangium gephyra]|uniref:Uncharacterized protein n=2 Tax=Archangium gephyra TaxID=48 RepID=A0ABX9JTZ4_9BACT|nr:hypothetical protein [Archangium gephyra]REG27055.1 hypothetical protein ATI61_11062 [Archangium gephyra]
MGWPLRMFQEEGYYFVTSRCYQGRLLLRPSVEMNEVVGGVLARAVQQSAGSSPSHAQHMSPRVKVAGRTDVDTLEVMRLSITSRSSPLSIA